MYRAAAENTDPFHPLFWSVQLRSVTAEAVHVVVPDAFVAALSAGALQADDAEQLAAAFPAECARLEAAANQLGGDGDGYVVKLCGKMPVDAVWVTPLRSLQCRSWRDALAMLRASVRVHADEAPSERLRPAVVSVLAWANIEPSLEFRGFAWDGTLLAICQRQVDAAYPFLGEWEADIVRAVGNFYHKLLLPVHPAYAHCVFDCYLDAQRQVQLVDMHRWDDRADPLLFTVAELERFRCTSSSDAAGDTPRKVHFRFVSEGMTPACRTVLDGVPLEMRDESLRQALERLQTQPCAAFEPQAE